VKNACKSTPPMVLMNTVEVMLTASKSQPNSDKEKDKGSIAPASRRILNQFDPARNGLEEYLRNPHHPRVISYNDDFVVIKDLYPKATVHLLILPRDEAKQHQHPCEAFEDSDFFSKVKAEAARWQTIAAKELARTLCPSSAPIPERDWEKEIKVGIHMNPSMNHLHIHVISRDMRSPFLRHRKHYNSFTTPFFAELHEFPLSEEEEYLKRLDWHLRDMTCRRCGMNFGNRFKALKEHLEQEFEGWKSELIKINPLRSAVA